MDKKCAFCGEQILGRSDKKYCSDYCRSSFHNQKQGANAPLIRRINYVLKKNRNILEGLNPEGKTTVSKNVLIKKGFNFNYITNIYVTRRNHEYRFCYDQGYIEHESGYFTLVVRQEYVD